MAASELTANLLPQFVEDDKPTWLGDFNLAMRKIDALFSAKQAEIDLLTTQLNIQTARITALAAATNHVGI